MSETAFDKLMTAGGYPNPAAVNGERKIWSASSALIRFRRICSASLRGTAAVTSPEIRQIVQEVYQHLPLPTEWTPDQRAEFLDREASTLSRRVAELAAEMGESMVREWITTHGQHPGYLEKVDLLQQAHRTAQEIVLTNELYEKIPPLEEENADSEQESDVPTERPGWELRWRQLQWRVEPTEDLEELVATVWPAPEFSAVFRVKAAYLLAARAEDGLDQPTYHGDPLAVRLTAMVNEDLERDGYRR